jgi:hypothetical protein
VAQAPARSLAGTEDRQRPAFERLPRALSSQIGAARDVGMPSTSTAIRAAARAPRPAGLTHPCCPAATRVRRMPHRARDHQAARRVAGCGHSIELLHQPRSQLPLATFSACSCKAGSDGWTRRSDRPRLGRACCVAAAASDLLAGRPLGIGARMAAEASARARWARIRSHLARARCRRFVPGVGNQLILSAARREHAHPRRTAPLRERSAPPACLSVHSSRLASASADSAFASVFGARRSAGRARDSDRVLRLTPAAALHRSIDTLGRSPPRGRAAPAFPGV